MLADGISAVTTTAYVPTYSCIRLCAGLAKLKSIGLKAHAAVLAALAVKSDVYGTAATVATV